MSNAQEFIKNCNKGSEYAHRFVADIETIDVPKGSTKEPVHFISKQKENQNGCWIGD